MIGRKCAVQLCASRGKYRFMCACDRPGLLCCKHAKDAKYIQLRCWLGGKCLQCGLILWMRWVFEKRLAVDVVMPGRVGKVSVCAECLIGKMQRRTGQSWRKGLYRSSTNAEMFDVCARCSTILRAVTVSNENEPIRQKADGHKFTWVENGSVKRISFCTLCVTSCYRSEIEKLARNKYP